MGTWTDEGLVAECTLGNGERGIIARTDIPPDKIIGIYGGVIRQYKLLAGQITDPAAREAVQLAVEGDTVFAMVTEPDGRFYGVDYLNHSCEPSVAIRRAPIIVATARVIRAGRGTARQLPRLGRGPLPRTVLVPGAQARAQVRHLTPAHEIR